MTKQTNVPSELGDTNKNQDGIKSTTSDEIAKNNLRTLANNVIELLQETIGISCDIVEDTNKHEGNYVYNINKQGVPFPTPAKGLPSYAAPDGQIKLTVLENGTISLNLTIYGENPDYIYYHIEGLTTQDFMAEMPNLNSFLTTGEVPTTSKLKKDSQRNSGSLKGNPNKGQVEKFDVDYSLDYYEAKAQAITDGKTKAEANTYAKAQADAKAEARAKKKELE